MIPLFGKNTRSAPQANEPQSPEPPIRRDVTIRDVLAAAYAIVERPPEAVIENTALLVIDIQHLSTPAYLQGKAIAAGIPADAASAALADYDARFCAALAQCKKVLEAARQSGVPAIHVKIQSLDAHGRDASPLHRRMGWLFPPSAPAAAFLPETAPLDDEIVIAKTASGAFTGTGLDATLSNMGVEHLFICGFVADECVETTARAALDLGYVTKIVSDATTTYDADACKFTIAKFASLGLAASADDTAAQFRSMQTLA